MNFPTPDNQYLLSFDSEGRFEFASFVNGNPVYFPNHPRYDPSVSPAAAQFLAQGYDISDRQTSQASESLAKAIEARLQEVSDIAKQLQDDAVAQYSHAEMQMWNLKAAESKALKNGESVEFIAIEAEVAGVPVEDLADVILRKAKALRDFSSMVSGTRSRHQRSIGLLQTVEEVMGYVVDGWPDLE